MDGFQGGRVAVPPSLMPEFLLRYAVDCYNASTGFLPARLFFVERLTPVFRFFVDLDCPLAADSPFQSTADEIWRRVLIVINVAIVYHFPTWTDEARTQHLQCVVLRVRDDVAAVQRGETLKKLGVHLVFPNLWVTVAMASSIRAFAVTILTSIAISQVLRRELDTLYPAVELPKLSDDPVELQKLWNDAFDAGQYKESGTLRMPWSHKAETCHACKASPQQAAICIECAPEPGKRGDGRFDRKRPYIVVDCVAGEGTRAGRLWSLQEELQHLQNNWAYAICRTSLRWETQFYADALEKAFRLAEMHEENGTIFVARTRDLLLQQLPSLLPPVPTSDFVMGPYSQAYGALVPRDKRTFPEETPLDGPAASTIRSLIRNSSPHYQYLQVVKITHTLARYCTFYVRVQGPGSSFCHNKNAVHKSSTIYFTVGAAGVQQRCFCAKRPTPGGQECRKFSFHLCKLERVQLTLIYGREIAREIADRLLRKADEPPSVFALSTKHDEEGVKKALEATAEETKKLDPMYHLTQDPPVPVEPGVTVQFLRDMHLLRKEHERINARTLANEQRRILKPLPDPELESMQAALWAERKPQPLPLPQSLPIPRTPKRVRSETDLKFDDCNI